jgi:hypothetical protein
VVKRQRRTEGGEAPHGQGATGENTGEYLNEEQRGLRGCIADRMPLAFRFNTGCQPKPRLGVYAERLVTDELFSKLDVSQLEELKAASQALVDRAMVKANANALTPGGARTPRALVDSGESGGPAERSPTPTSKGRSKAAGRDARSQFHRTGASPRTHPVAGPSASHSLAFRLP